MDCDTADADLKIVAGRHAACCKRNDLVIVFAIVLEDMKKAYVKRVGNSVERIILVWWRLLFVIAHMRLNQNV